MMTAVVLPAVPRVLIAESDPRVRETLSDMALDARADIELHVCTDAQQAADRTNKRV
ncbi:histidine kinase, partial [Pseudomonas syringae]